MTSSLQTIDAAADRFFRAYARHCVEPDEDSLFNLLDALHSFNDKLRKAGKGSLFGSSNFMALKALRNLFHHETELLHEIKIIPTTRMPQIVTDLGVVCLVDGAVVNRTVSREKAEQQDAIRGAFKWYGKVVNIQPCVFNGAVDVFEAVASADLRPKSESYEDFEASYRFEEISGHAHRVTGDIFCAAGSVEEVLQAIFQAAPTGATDG
ncbi:hypothetical protein IVA87_31490 [Bradyrhizobium sp. 147]|uniref:hypothetical protein n=1 Tax=Bradyrhizobium sp. 147 TaxID=2782623 RepID=UPI001FF898DE|nr:hypothetical protein [Bradyrhizobium sp. 147]MCK1683796.1 hypothetical protein [Bradyrhizobium sp. 147]